MLSGLAAPPQAVRLWGRRLVIERPNVVAPEVSGAAFSVCFLDARRWAEVQARVVFLVFPKKWEPVSGQNTTKKDCFSAVEPKTEKETTHETGLY